MTPLTLSLSPAGRERVRGFEFELLVIPACGRQEDLFEAWYLEFGVFWVKI
jgi:hypothetical protein